MKNVTTSLYAIAKHTSTYGGEVIITKDKEYPIFKITNGKYNKMVTFIDDNGELNEWASFHFRFITK